MADGLIIKDPKKVGYFNSYILSRIKRNKNFVCAVTGQTGSGKSYSCLTLGETLDPDFNIDNVCFTPREFMDLVNGKNKKLKSGSVILWDEMQVSMGHLDFQSIQSKAINYVLQTFRHRNFILLVSCPHLSFINASARKLLHAIMETVSIDKDKKQVILKPLLIQTNQRTGDLYFKYLRVVTPEGVCPLKRMRVGMASKELLKQYEQKKDEFTKKLNEDISRELEESDCKSSNELTEAQSNIIEDLMEGLTIQEIVKKRNIIDKMVYSHIKYAKKKGIKIKAIKEEHSNKVDHYEVEGYDVDNKSLCI